MHIAENRYLISSSAICIALSASMVFGSQVTVHFDKSDEDDRVVVNGDDVKLLQVASGLKWHCKANERESSPFDRGDYAKAKFLFN